MANKILIALLLVFTSSAMGAVCSSSITRTNYSTGQVLTSSSLNSQLNTVYNQVNELPGTCIEDATITVDEVNKTSFAVQFNAIKQGCFVSYSDSNTLSVGKCRIAVSETLTSTSSATTVDTGCGGCSTNSASTAYYVYTSGPSNTSSTMSLFIYAVEPDSDGTYPGIGTARVLARFKTDASANIEQYSIEQWDGAQFIRSETDWTNYTPTTQGLGTVTVTAGDFKWRKVGQMLHIRGLLTTGTVTSDGALINFPETNLTSYTQSGLKLVGNLARAVTSTGQFYAGTTSATNGISFVAQDGSNAFTVQAGTGVGSTTGVHVDALIGIQEWTY